MRSTGFEPLAAITTGEGVPLLLALGVPFDFEPPFPRGALLFQPSGGGWVAEEVAHVTNPPAIARDGSGDLHLCVAYHDGTLHVQGRPGGPWRQTRVGPPMNNTRVCAVAVTDAGEPRLAFPVFLQPPPRARTTRSCGWCMPTGAPTDGRSSPSPCPGSPTPRWSPWPPPAGGFPTVAAFLRWGPVLLGFNGTAWEDQTPAEWLGTARMPSLLDGLERVYAYEARSAETWSWERSGARP